MVNSPQLKGKKTSLIVDATGVGTPIVDMLREAKLSPIGVMITGGLHVTHENGYFHVPKRDLASSVTMLSGKKELKITSDLPFATDLHEELRNFQVKVNQIGHDSYESWRERDKDDLVLAIALACWYATWYAARHKPLPPVAPVYGSGSAINPIFRWLPGRGGKMEW